MLKRENRYIIIFTFVVVTYFLTSSGNTPYNYFTRLANAFIQGRYWLTDSPPWLSELIPVGPNIYFVVYPPMPAILAIPLVALFGSNFPQQYIAHFMGAIFALYWAKIALTITKNKKLTIWMFLLSAFGNIIWFLSSTGSSWYLGQVTATCFLTAAIYETMTKKRPLIAGIFIGAAYLSRIQTILSLPYFLYQFRSKRMSKYLKLVLGIAPFFLFNSAYNYIRFGVPWDKAYYLIPGLFDEPWFSKGLFNLSYIPEHLKIMFLSLPIFKNKFPYIQPSWAGLSIWITTPAFIYAALAKLKDKSNFITWLVIFAIGFVAFSHGTTGFAQFGYRFAVDFYPFLMLLTIKGLSGKKLKWHHWTLLIISIIVNAWGVIWINKFGWVSY